MLIKRRKFIVAFLVVVSFFSLPVSAQTEDPEDPRWNQESIPINPRGTYLRTCHDSPHSPTILDLFNDYGINILDWIVMRESGYYVPWTGQGDISRDMIAVFSSLSYLHPDSVTQRYRVPGAVSFTEYPNLVTTPPTYLECEEQAGQEAKNLVTDIPEDFWICCADKAVLVHVPAQYLFVSNFSDYWKDNRDPNGDYKVEFSNYIKWEQHSNLPPSECRSCWDQVKNWDVEAVPRSEVGVIFDTSFNTSAEVTEANGTINFLIIENAEAKFEDGISLKTTCDAEKYDFLVDGIMEWNGGFLETCKSHIGKDNPGRVIVSDGDWNSKWPLYVGSKEYGSLTILAEDSNADARVNALDDLIIGDSEKSSGLVTVSKGGTLFYTQLIVGNHGSGTLRVSDGGIVHEDIYGIWVGKEKGSNGIVEVSGSGSKINAEAIWVGFKDNAKMTISNNGRVYSKEFMYIGFHYMDKGTATVNVKSDGELIVLGELYIRKKGNLIINEGGVSANAILVSSGGSIKGCDSGTVNTSGGVINMSGSVEAGCSIGTLIIDGDFIQESAGTLVFEVGGNQKGQEYDVLEVRGNATINGSVQVNFVDGFAPKQGDVFEFTNVTGSASQNLSKVETGCVTDDFQYKTELVGGKLTMTALNDAKAIPCGEPKGIPAIPLLLLED